MGMMNRQMNLPQIQRIMREFERESQTMDLKEEMMSDAVDEVMDDEAEGVGEEEEGDAILKEVLDEIGVSLGQQVSGSAGRDSSLIALDGQTRSRPLFHPDHSWAKRQQAPSMPLPQCLCRRSPSAKAWAPVPPRAPTR